MYNSFIVRIFVGAFDAFTLAYEGSTLKRIVDAFKKCILYLTNGSIFISIFTKSFSFIEKSVFYRLVSTVLDFGTNILKKLNNFTKKIGEESVVYNSFSRLFGTSVALVRSLAVFVLFFAIGIILNNLSRGAFSGKSYMVSFVLIIGTTTVIALGEGLEKLLNNSLACRFIMDLFTIDEEGGDHWW